MWLKNDKDLRKIDSGKCVSEIVHPDLAQKSLVVLFCFNHQFRKERYTSFGTSKKLTFSSNKKKDNMETKIFDTDKRT